MRQIILDVHCMERKAEAHEYLKDTLELPDYYGKNLDALYDCLTEMDDVMFIFENEDEGCLYFEKIRRVFRDAAKENEGISILRPDGTEND